MAWENLITYFEGFPCPINNSSTQKRIECLVKGINRIRFECCLEQRGQIKYLGAPEGHSGGVRIDPTLHNNVQISFGWTDHMYHVGSTWDYRSVVDAGLLSGGKGDNQEDTFFFTAVKPFMRNGTSPLTVVYLFSRKERG